jgi:hypothetical protein
VRHRPFQITGAVLLALVVIPVPICIIMVLYRARNRLRESAIGFLGMPYRGVPWFEGFLQIRRVITIIALVFAHTPSARTLTVLVVLVVLLLVSAAPHWVGHTPYRLLRDQHYDVVCLLGLLVRLVSRRICAAMLSH